jgi:hypothetical protein
MNAGKAVRIPRVAELHLIKHMYLPATRLGAVKE